MTYLQHPRPARRQDPLLLIHQQGLRAQVWSDTGEESFQHVWDLLFPEGLAVGLGMPRPKYKGLGSLSSRGAAVTFPLKCGSSPSKELLMARLCMPFKAQTGSEDLKRILSKIAPK